MSEVLESTGFCMLNRNVVFVVAIYLFILHIILLLLLLGLYRH